MTGQGKRCSGCGAPFPSDVPEPSQCHDCPARPCSDCGESDDRYCRCWVSVEGMALADLKAIFAPDFSITRLGDSE